MKYDVIILAGGLGTRLRSVVADLPKPMAEVGGKPFLWYILNSLQLAQVKHIYLAVGYKYDAIKDYFGDHFKGVNIIYSVENEPLGTGGGIKQALKLCTEEEVLILNGDTMFNVNHDQLLNFHRSHNAQLSLALKPMQKPSRYGSVQLDKDSTVKAFREKDENLEFGLINGGVYFANRSIIDLFPEQEKCSFEQDILEEYVNRSFFKGMSVNSMFIDIGIPIDYAKAQKLFKPKEAWRNYTLFLDRDGVINKPKADDYVKSAKEFEFTTEAIEAIRELKSRFKHVIVLTNQQGIDRSIMTISDLEDVHLKMYNTLKMNNVDYFDLVLYAPYLRVDEHHWRKPEIGMPKQAKNYLDIDFDQCVMLGDSPGDMELADNIGAAKVRILNEQFNFDNQDLFFSSLAEFAHFITQN